jgi:hypothetical protein
MDGTNKGRLNNALLLLGGAAILLNNIAYNK